MNNITIKNLDDSLKNRLQQRAEYYKRSMEEEAKEILTNLYNSKINFHNMKNFSHQERYGRPHSASLARIESLRISLQKVTEAIREAEKTNQMIKIGSAVEIGFIGELQ